MNAEEAVKVLREALEWIKACAGDASEGASEPDGGTS